MSEPEPEPLVEPNPYVPDTSFDDFDISAEVAAIDFATYRRQCCDRHKDIERDPDLNVGAGTSGAPVGGGPSRQPFDEGSGSDSDYILSIRPLVRFTS